MTIALRVILIIVSFMTVILMLRKIRQSKVQIEYAIFWILLPCILVLFSVFPSIVTFLANLIGVAAPVNFVFLAIIFILMIKSFMMTLELSQLEQRVKELTQIIAINEKKDRDRRDKEQE